ncbi:MAG: 2-C-methyl-D-erythritol 4-phosphate cytidylyltransferase [Candidatus Binataceae bacterium]
MKASAIIVAAGSGSRLGRSEPKAFVPLAGRTLLSYSLATIARVAAIAEVVIAVPAGMEKAARAEASALSVAVKITAGGAERQDSVRVALALTSVESEVVIVHDAARPFATAETFAACLAAAERAGGAIAAIPVADTLKRVGDDRAIIATVARAALWQAQTPQAFRRALLVSAHDRAMRDQIAATDDADLVERIGARVEIVESATPNLKITTAADLALAEALMHGRIRP